MTVTATQRAASAPSELTATQRSALKRAAWRLLPLLTIAYLFNDFDRTVVGFAALTMNRDIGLTSSQFGFGAGLLFITYCLFEIPSNLALYRVGPRLWLARIMITWGLISASTAFVVGPYSFYAARLLLGAAEAGYFVGVTYYLSAWFPVQTRTRMLAWFLVGIPLSTVIGGPLAGLLLQLDGVWGFAGWQWLFFGVSLPCVAFGLITYTALSDRPQDAAWLTSEERDALVGMLMTETRERQRSEFWPAVRDLRVLVLAGVQFCFTLGSYGIGIWLPQIVKDYKFSNLEVSLIVAVPYLFASVAMIIWAWHIDRTGKKVANLAIACFLGAVGLVASVLLSGALLAALTGLTVALVGVTSARAIFWNVPTRFLTGIGAAGGLAFINTIGVFGGFVGPSMMGWLKDLTGSFTAGLMVMAAIMLAATLLAASLKLLVKHE
jgi:ACS family tartrate transporter-like MFS transporter